MRISINASWNPYPLTIDPMSDKFSHALGLAEASPANVEDTLLVQRHKPVELRSRKAHTFLKPSEYDALIARIGREPVSAVLRELVLDFIRRNHD